MRQHRFVAQLIRETYFSPLQFQKNLGILFERLVYKQHLFFLASGLVFFLHFD